MARALWLPTALRDAGLTVIEHPGWQARGASTLNPRGIVCHHTASNANSGDAPSLSICINGRSDLPGPLCQLLIGRTGTCHVIASGVANHAGSGGWNGLSGNSQVLGIEVENNGVGEPWTPGLIDAFQRAAAALMVGAGQTTAANCCYHREWTSRKIDPAGPGIPSGNDWRARVQALMNGDDVTVEELQRELVNADKRAKAREDAIVKELAWQAQKHNAAARERDAKLLAVLERIEAKLP